MKLSKPQQDLVDAMKQGVTIHYMGYMGRFNPHAYYFRADTNKKCTASADALIDKGIARRTDGRHAVLELIPNVELRGCPTHDTEKE